MHVPRILFCGEREGGGQTREQNKKQEKRNKEKARGYVNKTANEICETGIEDSKESSAESKMSDDKKKTQYHYEMKCEGKKKYDEGTKARLFR